MAEPLSSRDIGVLKTYLPGGTGVWMTMPEEDRAAYRRIHERLTAIAGYALGQAQNSTLYDAIFTSGFNLQSGVRGNRPKDLWCTLCNKNSETLINMPQVFTIVSHRGVEIGFAAAIHPSDFSNQAVKAKLRSITPFLFDMLPDPESDLVATLSRELLDKGYCFRAKARLDPDGRDYETLTDLINFLKSERGKHTGGGAISRYVAPNELDDPNLDLAALYGDAVRIFTPFMRACAPDRVKLHTARNGGPSPQPNRRRYWIEKTLVAGQTERETGEHRLGEALWSPHTSKDGKNIYQAMLEVEPADVILHLIDNRRISGVSLAVSKADPDFSGLENTEWADRPCYRIQLGSYQELEPPLERERFLVDPAPAEELRQIHAAHGEQRLFYQQNLELRQGAYLTEAPKDLVAVLNRVYRDVAGHPIPHIGDLGLEMPPGPPRAKPAEPTETEEAEEVEVTEEEELAALPVQSRYTIDDFVADTGFHTDTITGWQRRLLRKLPVVFQGPPGTGKTFVAERLARMLVSETTGVWDVVQFHPSYSYEDFMQGIRPQVISGGLTYQIEPGRFLDFCRKAERRTDGAPCVLIVDELNRANLSRVFGELMYLLEYRDKKIPLSIGGEEFQIPKNVYLIGTMNTADRSIALVDHALRRRFSFIHLEPAYEVLRQRLENDGFPSGPLISVLEAINREIDDRNFEIGISFFMKDGAGLRDAIVDIWKGEIEPYLEEYFYDQPKRVDAFRWDGLVASELKDWA